MLNFDAASSTATVNIGRSEVWVYFNDRGVAELGTFAAPYNTLAEGLNIVATDATLKIKAGSTRETAVISRTMSIEAFGGTVTLGR